MDDGDIGSSEFTGHGPFQPVDSDSEDPEAASRAIQRQKLIKEIQSLQQNLKGVLDEIKKVEGEFEKKKAENEMLQTYVNNLTRQNMLITNAK
ncbi:hypothetical protein PTTG_07498 [Puccinia triticina 1-1 BBBD Race 1]|uniref:Uncharacterized protein n=2 Tax=Puccinia triticina TaxID=208348 RepID=A0A0C4F324_PUCT1|nr:uncharacterized protein PtA15_6A362 [Puccinia triticina]OAV96894.1 hypothetical protein PTTG_07498 [Puccinia triticina 1-1 BBBD Race 1]WAQ85733.1 hypothetical protein PtA15_6A362 [Puccinia triticina]WAR55608.1 hypothetical protein PtB15_6B351 [Puccinia triticina]